MLRTLALAALVLGATPALADGFYAEDGYVPVADLPRPAPPPRLVRPLPPAGASVTTTVTTTLPDGRSRTVTTVIPPTAYAPPVRAYAPPVAYGPPDDCGCIEDRYVSTRERYERRRLQFNPY